MNKKKVKILILVISCIIIVTVFGTPFFVDLCSPHKKSEISADGILGYIIGA